MAASVHDANFGAVGSLYFHVAGIGQTGIFDNRQCIHIGSDVYRWTRAIAKNSDDSVGNKAGHLVLAKVVGDVVAELAQLSGNERRRFFLLRGQLWILVQMFVGGDERIHFLADALVQIGLCGQRQRSTQDSETTERHAERIFHRGTSEEEMAS